jgi:uncharacterized protein YecE (DUF72 family)
MDQPDQFDRDAVKARAAELAAQGVFIGTSSWKYEGWLGALYNSSRYEYRGKLAKTRFERGCLTEYAEVFKTVCVDAAYYTFPSEKYLAGLAVKAPLDFQFGFKVTDEITLKKFPNLARFGERAGKVNERFLDASLFVNGFLRPCETIRNNVGVLIFEFTRFWPSDYRHGRDFVADLDGFLGKLPKGWPYAVELRNKDWLRAEYFDCLGRHSVSRVFNSWDAMPPVAEQMSLPGSRPNPALVAARFLLKPGRKYEEVVKTFSPYDRVKEVNEEARKAGAALIAEGRKSAGGKTLIFVKRGQPITLTRLEHFERLDPCRDRCEWNIRAPSIM